MGKPRGVALCHPEEKHHSNNLCYKCYKQQYHLKYYAKNKEYYTAKSKAWAAANPEHRYRYKDLKRRNQWLAQGIDPDTAQNAVDTFSGVCPICKREIILKGVGQFAVDHCHITGKVREVICGNCNVGLGRFKDSIEILSNAIQYLRRHA